LKGNELIIFPTELSRRRWQQEQVMRTGWLDASHLLTKYHLRKLCVLYARNAGLLTGEPCDAARELLMRRQVVTAARARLNPKGPLASLSDTALADVLRQLITELSGLGDTAQHVEEWMLGHAPQSKIFQLGMLYRVWREKLKESQQIDRRDLNSAIIKLLSGERRHWPPLLRNAAKITFRSVRWLNPFDEQMIEVLKRQLGPQQVRVFSALPAAHAEKTEDCLGARIRSEIMQPVEEAWSAWVEDLSDALEVDSTDVLQADNADRISFSRSAGDYGEIEDIARRICYEFEECNVPWNRIALVVPDLGAVQDIVPHVFERFQIPYWFRRGRPVLSAPCVKAFLSLLSWPLRCERDQLIDLLRNPTIIWGREDTEEIVEMITDSGAPPRLEKKHLPERLYAELMQFNPLETLHKKIRVDEEDELNREAVRMVEHALENLGDPIEWSRAGFLDLLEELLENMTIHSEKSDDQGVWILNPYDSIGLRFDTVLFAGLNDGVYPVPPQPSALIDDSERRCLREDLAKQGIHLPKLALPGSDIKMVWQTVLFLSALGMARERLVLSCQSIDVHGVEKAPSTFYRKIWNLAGWGANREPVLSSYDDWRIKKLGNDSIFSRHWEKQRQLNPEDRLPMPGESFLPVVPRPLCRARDEARQADAHDGKAPEQIAEMIAIEMERETFTATPVDERRPSVYCGYIHRMKEKVARWLEKKGEFSPTALETLAQGRYVFLLEQILGIREERVIDDVPDPLDRGTLFHSIICAVYSALAGNFQPLEKIGFEVPKSWKNICIPRYWAEKTSSGWKKVSSRREKTIPLAGFFPDIGEEILLFGKLIAEKFCTWAEQSGKKLGHPGVWAADKQKLLVEVENVLRFDVENATAENRFPALFELKFGKKQDCPLELCGIFLKGRIDRVDMIFKDDTLCSVRVLDYKGSSLARSKKEEYVDEVRLNLDCQLPVYAFAAQKMLFGEFDTEPLNAMTEAGYVFRERDYEEFKKKLGRSCIPLNKEGMLEGFKETLAENLRRLREGDFAVDPLVKSYTDWQSVCRVLSVAREDME